MEIENKDMTPILLEDLGMRFTSNTKKYKARYGLYQCQYCGKEFEARVSTVNNKSTKSCGCYRIQNTINIGKANKIHNFTNHTLYQVWNAMLNRCHNSKRAEYIDYGGRGIQVCERWLDIKNFIEDMYPSYQEGLTLDRIDVNGNYEPDNCRWTTKEVQARNIRNLKSNNSSGFRGVSWNRNKKIWVAQISISNKKLYIGSFQTALEAAKAYERYVRLNNLEHNFTPALTSEEIEEINKKGIK